MAGNTVVEAPSAPKLVGLGQAILGTGPTTLTSVLGSCVGVLMYHRRAAVGILAHVVLPNSTGREGNAAKYADLAIPYMLELLAQAGASVSGVTVKLAGGSSMFGTGNTMQIGDSNIKAVIAALAKARLAPVAMNVGGIKGRRVSLDCSSGKVTVEIAGLPVEIL